MDPMDMFNEYDREKIATFIAILEQTLDRAIEKDSESLETLDDAMAGAADVHDEKYYARLGFLVDAMGFNFAEELKDKEYRIVG